MENLDFDNLFRSDRDLISKLSLNNSRWNDEEETILNEQYDENEIDVLYKELGLENTNIVKNDMIISNREVIENCYKLIPMLSKRRAHRYIEWIRVGWALHNTDLSLLELWKTFQRDLRSIKKENVSCGIMDQMDLLFVQ